MQYSQRGGVGVFDVADHGAQALAWDALGDHDLPANPLATRSGVGAAEDAPNAGAAVVHGDAWNMPSSNVHPWVNLRDDEGNVHRVRVH
jgi:hypothetical protein